jgi:flavodoxin
LIIEINILNMPYKLKTMKDIVIFYSKKGNNRYLANKIAKDMDCEIQEIKPGIDWPLLFWLGINFGISKIKVDLTKFDRIILVGPIWMGKFIVPLKAFVNKYNKKINKMIFVTCCGSSYEKKDEQFGHGLVFKQVREIMKEKCIDCLAFPIVLVVPDDKLDDGKYVMDTRLSDVNFHGEIKERYDSFIENLKSKQI